MMQSRLLRLSPWITLVAGVLAACSSTTTTPTPINSTGSSTGMTAGTGAASGTVVGTGGATGTSGSAGTGSSPASGVSTTGAVPSGASAGTGSGTGGVSTGAASGASTGMASGATSGAGTTGASGSGGVSGASDGGITSHAGSPGCGKPWTGTTGKWLSQPAGCAQGTNNQGTAACQTIQGVSGWSAPGVVIQTPNPHTPSIETSDEQRGWWVLVPDGYDPTKPYRVIYGFAGCGDGNYFNAGQDGYNYTGVDDAQAIQVGADYDTFSDVPTCYDNRTPTSNDFAFVPWLMNTIENEFCVDVNHQYVSGYSSGGWVVQQMNCAYPDKFRGEAALTGCEPGGGGEPGSQPTCVNKPTAMIYVHDLNDTANPYQCMIPGCARMLKQNGCTVTTCNPQDTSLTTPYTPPAGVTVPGKCVSFNGCPTDYPVVFCVLQGTQHGDSQTSWGITKLFWDFMSNKLAD